jgi:hypothetical protein
MPAAPRMYLIVVYRPLPAAPLVLRCMYMVVVPGPMPAAVVKSSQVNTLPKAKSKTRWLVPRLTCGSMLEVSRDAVAAGEEQLVSCTAEQSKFFSICTVALALAAICLSRVGVVGGARRR